MLKGTVLQGNLITFSMQAKQGEMRTASWQLSVYSNLMTWLKCFKATEASYVYGEGSSSFMKRDSEIFSVEDIF